MKVLIFGDSFAADWSVKYNDYKGWPNLLAEKFEVVNIAQAGVSEFKIYCQLENVNLDEYDVVICSHTGPHRVPTKSHPIHSNDSLHYSADLIWSDIEYHSSKLKNFFNLSLRAAKNFFRYHYDNYYFETTYKLYREAINRKMKGKKYIVVNFFEDMKKFEVEKNVVEFSHVFAEFNGKINHLDKDGNQIVFKTLMGKI